MSRTRARVFDFNRRRASHGSVSVASIARETTRDAAERRVGLDEHQRGTPSCPDRGKSDPEQPIALAKTRSSDRAFQGVELLSQRDIFENQLVMSTARHSQRAAEQQNHFQHAVILWRRARLNQMSRGGRDCGEGHVSTMNYQCATSCTIGRRGGDKTGSALISITLPDSPAQALDARHVAGLIAATLRPTATALRDEPTPLPQWLVYRRDERVSRADQVQGPYYVGVA